MPVKPVVDGLAGGADHWPSKGNTNNRQEPVIGDANPRGHNAAGEGPHGWKPGNGLKELENGRKRRLAEVCRAGRINKSHKLHFVLDK